MEYFNSADGDGAAVAADVARPVVQEAGPREGRAKRRTFSPEYKRQIVAEYDAAPQGSKCAVLRRERLYDSHIQEWRAAIGAGTLQVPLKRGRPARSEQQAAMVALERENARLQAQVRAKDEVIADRDQALDVLGKGVAFLDSLSSRNAS